MSKYGFRYVRKINDGRRKPYFGRFWCGGEMFQVGGFATAAEAHQAALAGRLELREQPERAERAGMHIAAADRPGAPAGGE